MTSGSLIPAQPDQDWKITGVWDFDGDGHRDDLLLRHCVLGFHQVWQMDGFTRTGILPIADEYDPYWHAGTQDLTVSTWRFDPTKQNDQFIWFEVSPATPSIRVHAQNFGQQIRYKRREFGQEQWTVLATSTDSSYLDLQVTPGVLYEYQVSNFFFMSETTPYVTGLAGIDLPPVENRGRILLVIDQVLNQYLGNAIDSYEADLIGDGWTVAKAYAPRHSMCDVATYKDRVATVKALIEQEYDNWPNDLRAVQLIGHIPVPYSGLYAPDGHSCEFDPFTNTFAAAPDHRGAWSADMYYAAVDSAGNWGDSSANYNNCYDDCDPCNDPQGDCPDLGSYNDNIPDDGKWDLNFFPEGHRIKFAIGRIDFARLPVFFTGDDPSAAEATLITRYFAKNRAFRNRTGIWDSHNYDRALAYGSFAGPSAVNNRSLYQSAVQNTAFWFGWNSEKLEAGDVFFQTMKSHLFGFLAGSGSWDRINNSQGKLEHRADQLESNEPRACIYTILASFLGDFNTGENNYLRSLLATENYGLAAVWTRNNVWRYDGLALGRELGTSLTLMVNARDGNIEENRRRDLAILGDVALRANPIMKPEPVQWTENLLEWTSSGAGCTYHIYRGPAANGPFTKLTTSGAIQQTYYVPQAHTDKFYMVRALRPVTVANGSYTAISQGLIKRVDE